MIKAIWGWFNGKKTTIGFILETVGTGLISQYPTAGLILQVVGGALGGTGVVHKIIKGDLKTDR